MKWILMVACCLLALPMNARSGSQAEAEQVLDRTLALMTHPGGTRFNYKFHLGRLFNRYGTFIYKQDKSLSWNTKEMVWADGKTVWALDRRKRIVRIMNPSQSRKGLKGMDEQMAMARTDYDVTMHEEGNEYVLTLKAKTKKADAREAQVWIEKKSYHPLRVKLKISVFWGTVEISDFRTGNYKDSMFSFPKEKYADVKMVDKRK
ncbi:MAG: outer-membrane lipoprotein carrier protein LolA [Bacteroidaceae bacterium]|nr:outer-membrane lipoprotein carrier protein LolA [Bacteroidaceae bacterium]